MFKLIDIGLLAFDFLNTEENVYGLLMFNVLKYKIDLFAISKSILFTVYLLICIG